MLNINVISFKQFFLEQVAEHSSLLDVPRRVMHMSNTPDNLPKNKPYGFWIDKSGNWIDVRRQAHSKTGLAMIMKANEWLSEQGLPKLPNENSYIMFGKAGWARVVTEGNTVMFEMLRSTYEPTRHQYKMFEIIKDMYNMNDIFNDTAGFYD
jgi:hypothetical protein